MANDQDPVHRQDKVGLDEVGALIDGQAIAHRRVLGALAARAPMGDDDRLLHGLGHDGGGRKGGGGGGEGAARQMHENDLAVLGAAFVKAKL